VNGLTGLRRLCRLCRRGNFGAGRSILPFDPNRGLIMQTLRITLLLLVVATTFAACKKGGGYMHTAPAPAATP
jgi:hypothetical protein